MPEPDPEDAARLARSVRNALFVATPVVSLAGLAAEIAEYELGAPGPTVEIFSLSYEQNVPTWFATVLLFSCAAALASIASHAQKHRAAWWILSAIFLYMSLDEAIELHEHLGGLIVADGLLFFSWVIPAAIAVVVIGAAFVPFLLALPSASRTRFIVAGAIYVGGALVMELPLGAWTSEHGDDNLTYGVIDWIEESLELAGASFFLTSLVRHRASVHRASA
jgi:hypothetical protein